MSKEKFCKTNAMRILDKNKIHYDINTYECEEFIDGVTIAKKLNQPEEKSYKTIVTCGKSKEYFVFLIPVNKEIDLKRAAKAVGEKSVELIHVKDINSITGYIRGGCTPLGMKKIYPTVIDLSAKKFDTIIISGGKIGVQIIINLNDLSKVINAKFDKIVVN